MFLNLKLSRFSRIKLKAIIKRDNRLIINLSSFIIKHIVNIVLMRVEKHEHNLSQFSFNMIFVKSDRINKYLFKSRFSASCSQRSNDLLFILNSTTVNDRSLKINNIFLRRIQFFIVRRYTLSLSADRM